MFKTERIFSAQFKDTGVIVWYFLTREGREGPFASQTEAQQQLHEFIVARLNDPKRIPRTRFLHAING